jgi:hypothetical protein
MITTVDLAAAAASPTPQNGDGIEHLVLKLHTALNGKLTGVRTQSGATLLDHVEYSVTVDPATDVITTASAHNFVADDSVFFTAATLPTGLVANTRYYVRDVTSTSFKVSATSGGAAINLTTAGTTVIATANNGLKRGGNTVIGRGNNQTTTSTYGESLCVIGNNNTIAWLGLPTGYAHKNSVSPALIFGSSNTIANAGQGWFMVGGYTNNIDVGASGGTSVCFGDQHFGGGTNCSHLGGFHNEIRGAGYSGTAKTGSVLTGLGGMNMVAMGAGISVFWQGTIGHVGHANKDMGWHKGTLTRATADSGGGGTIANAGASRTDELFLMRYYTGSNKKWLRIPPNKVVDFEFRFVVTLEAAATPTYAVFKRRASYYQGADTAIAPVLIGSIETVGTDKGSNAGAPPTGWSVTLTPGTDGVRVFVTVQNDDTAARNVNSICSFEAVECDTN